uniref:Reverse transcriptase domain-containing protein n=1 Tax=Tanacetum cinerariifolium TaxID=118510 RepID=A0A6L2NLI8_TANCI|nr:hypothetical protein [Tanacetum cinerariifolium]
MDVYAGNPQCVDWLKRRVVQSTGEIKGLKKQSRLRAKMRAGGANSYFLNNSSVTIPRRQNKRHTPNVVEPELHTIVELADNRTMEELLQAPTEGYGEAIVISKINADHFEIKTNLIQLVQANPYHGFERENPHTHINNFKRITLTLKFRDVPNDVIKLMMFPYSFEGTTRVWMNTASRENVSKTDDRIDKLADQISTLVDIFAKKVVTLAPVVERETDETTDKEQTNFQGSTAHIQPPVTSILEPDVSKTLPEPNISYPSRLNDQKLREKATNQMEKFFQIFQDLHFDISFADALLLMPKFASTIKSFLTNKDKLFELAKIPLNENCSAMLLKKLPEKLEDPGKFLIPCNFPGMDVCHALGDLADRSITRPKGVVEDVFVKVGNFHFPTYFVVVYFEANPRVPLILGRSFLRIGRALIDVYGEEITLRVNRIDIIEPILSDSSPSFTPFEGSDFILEEIDVYLKDKSISPEIDHACCDPEGDICLIEKLLNNDSFQLPLMDLKQGEVVKEKSSIEKPSELELKDLPSNLEYAYLEGVDNLPVIIVKDLKVDEKEALLKVIKSHKRAIAWKITDIKGIDPRFCTYKILMEEDYKPAVQSQR